MRNLNIGKKIGIGFAVIVVATMSIFLNTDNTLSNSRTINDQINEVNNPTLEKLAELKLMIVRSKMLVNNWVNFQSRPDVADKIALERLIDEKYPILTEEIITLSEEWDSTEVIVITDLLRRVDVLFESHKLVMEMYLPDFTAYEDPINKFQAEDLIDPNGGEITLSTANILTELDLLIEIYTEKSTKSTTNMNASFNRLQNAVRILGLLLVVATILIALLLTRNIVKPVRGLQNIIQDLSKGIFPKTWVKESGDEIGEMAGSLQILVDGLKQTKEFAQEVGSGRYDSNYKPLSDQDELGNSLLVMRQSLKEYAEEMEAKVKERTAKIAEQNKALEAQKDQIAELYDQVTDSIVYAKRIQEAILPSDDEIAKSLEEYMILFKPKDIVSGDFYWYTKKNGKDIFCAADCTGHGVPGALMSMVGTSLLKEIVNEKGITEPGEILTMLKAGIISQLNQGGASGEDDKKDGMDIAMLVWDQAAGKMEFSGAYNPLVQIRGEELIETKADRQPVGLFYGKEDMPFTNNVIEYQKGDTFYMFSDGYIDQFGGPRGKKFKVANFKKLLLTMQDKSMAEQKIILDRAIEDWMEDHEQIDDIIVVGIRV